MPKATVSQVVYHKLLFVLMQGLARILLANSTCDLATAASTRAHSSPIFEAESVEEASSTSSTHTLGTLNVAQMPGFPDSDSSLSPHHASPLPPPGTVANSHNYPQNNHTGWEGGNTEAQVLASFSPNLSEGLAVSPLGVAIPCSEGEGSTEDLVGNGHGRGDDQQTCMQVGQQIQEGGDCLQPSLVGERQGKATPPGMVPPVEGSRTVSKETEAVHIGEDRQMDADRVGGAPPHLPDAKEGAKRKRAVAHSTSPEDLSKGTLKRRTHSCPTHPSPTGPKKKHPPQNQNPQVPKTPGESQPKQGRPAGGPRLRLAPAETEQTRATPQVSRTLPTPSRAPPTTPKGPNPESSAATPHSQAYKKQQAIVLQDGSFLFWPKGGVPPPELIEALSQEDCPTLTPPPPKPAKASYKDPPLALKKIMPLSPCAGKNTHTDAAFNPAPALDFATVTATAAATSAPAKTGRPACP